MRRVAPKVFGMLFKPKDLMQEPCVVKPVRWGVVCVEVTPRKYDIWAASRTEGYPRAFCRDQKLHFVKIRYLIQ